MWRIVSGMVYLVLLFSLIVLLKDISKLLFTAPVGNAPKENVQISSEEQISSKETGFLKGPSGSEQKRKTMESGFPGHERS